MNEAKIQLSNITAWFARSARTWKQREPRKLRLRETLSLGEHRLITLLECDAQLFLIGSTENSLSLLTNLKAREPEPPFDDGVPTWAFRELNPDGCVQMYRS